MGGSSSKRDCCPSEADNQAIEADLKRISREKEQIAREEEEKAKERARLAAIPPIGLIVQRDDGEPDIRLEVRPWEPVHGSLSKALELACSHELIEAWMGELRLDCEGSWENQGVVDGAAVQVVVKKKTGLIVVSDQMDHKVRVMGLELRDQSSPWLHVDDSHTLDIVPPDQVRSFGSEGSGPGQFDRPEGVAVDEQGNVIVADYYNSRVQVFRLKDGSHVRTIGSYGSGPGHFDRPEAVAFDGQGNLIVADTDNDRVQVLRLEDGSHVRTIGSDGDGPDQFKHPHDVAFDGAGVLWGPRGLALDGKGMLIVVDCNHNQVKLYRLEDGSYVRAIGSAGSGPGQFDFPLGVAVDGQGNILVADCNNHRVQVFRLEDGNYVRTIGSKGREPGQFIRPRDVAVDGQGNLIVCDAGNSRLQVLRLEDGGHVRTVGHHSSVPWRTVGVAVAWQ